MSILVSQFNVQAGSFYNLDFKKCFIYKYLPVFAEWKKTEHNMDLLKF